MKKIRNRYLFPTIVSMAVVVALSWSAYGTALETGTAQDVAGGTKLLTSDTGISDPAQGKRSTLPEVSPNDPEFWNKNVRDPFKVPKSKQLCSAGVIEACEVPERSPGSSKG